MSSRELLERQCGREAELLPVTEPATFCMIIFMLLSGAASLYYLRRQKRA